MSMQSLTNPEATREGAASAHVVSTRNYVHGPVFTALSTISASCSIVGSMAVILVFIVFPQLRRHFARLALYIAISDLWLCSAIALGDVQSPPHNAQCMVQAAFGCFFGLSSVLWTAVLADSLRRVLLSHDLELEAKHEARLHIFVWGTSFAALFIALLSGTLGPSGTVCWIKNTATGTVVRIFTFYMPLWLTVAYSSWLYWTVAANMRSLLQQHQVGGGDDYELNALEYKRSLEQQWRSLKIMLLPPFILAFCWTPSSIRRLLEVFVPDLGKSFLDYFSACFSPLQGALNALLYGATPAFRDAVMGRLDHSARILKGVQARLQAARKGKLRNLRKSHKLDGSSESLHLTQDSSNGPAPRSVGRALPLDDAEDWGPLSDDQYGALSHYDRDGLIVCDQSDDIDHGHHLAMGNGQSSATGGEVPEACSNSHVSVSLQDDSDPVDKARELEHDHPQDERDLADEAKDLEHSQLRGAAQASPRSQDHEISQDFV